VFHFTEAGLIAGLVGSRGRRNRSASSGVAIRSTADGCARLRFAEGRVERLAGVERASVDMANFPQL